jgi:serine/threonine protein kinase
VCPTDNVLLELTGELAPGMVIRGKYLVLDQIGEGGMGRVYSARHLAFNELRALKVINPLLAGDSGYIRRFKTEAVIARKLQHPNAVRIDDLDATDDGLPFIVMELVEGESLKSLILRMGCLPIARCVEITAQTADALGAAHDLGIVHRDIKPDNILVTQAANGADLVKVADLGIAKVLGDKMDVQAGYTATKSGMIIGTPQYLSPEQATGLDTSRIDGRADIYSLGIVLYVMLTGRLPFESDTPLGFLVHHIHTVPPDPNAIRPDRGIPGQLSAVLLKSIEKDRDNRFATAREFSQALRTVGSTLLEIHSGPSSTRPDQAIATQQFVNDVPLEASSNSRAVSADDPQARNQVRSVFSRWLAISAVVVVIGTIAAISFHSGIRNWLITFRPFRNTATIVVHSSVNPAADGKGSSPVVVSRVFRTFVFRS